jgi:hypothetical protein
MLGAIKLLFAFLVPPSPQLHDKIVHRPVFISGVKEFLTTLPAISQLVWFRLLYPTGPSTRGSINGRRSSFDCTYDSEKNITFAFPQAEVQ